MMRWAAILLIFTLPALAWGQRTVLVHEPQPLGGYAHIPLRSCYDPQLFVWTESGKEYHKAVCVVKSPGGSCGSGVYLDWQGMTGVLTCQHVVGQSADMHVTFSDGKTLSGQARTDRYGHDIAWVEVQHPSITPVKFSDTGPVAGEFVELVSRGGPLSRLRHWQGTVSKRTDATTLRLHANITPGDSGGTILNARGEAIGVCTHGVTTVTRIDGWVVYGEAGSPGYGPIRAFLARVKAILSQGCPDGRCPPYRPRERYGPLYPPYGYQPQPQPIPQPDIQPPTPEAPPVSPPENAGLSSRLEKLERELLIVKSFQERMILQGPKGDKGDAGESPSAAEVAALLKAEMYAQVSADIRSDLTAWLNANKESLRGPQGEAGQTVDMDALVKQLPPVRLHIYDDVNGDGVMSESETFRLAAPLGEPIKLEVTGGINAKKKSTP